MSNAGLLNIGIRALNADSIALNTISHNISNVNTPGYSRQNVQLANEQGKFTGAGFFGNGVRVVTIARDTNAFLTREVLLSSSQQAMDQARLDQLKQLEKLFPTGAQSIGQSVQNFFNSFADVATNPQDQAARQVVLAQAAKTANSIQTAGEQMTIMQQSIVTDLRVSVDRVNQLASQVADMNQQIAIYQGSDHTPNDLLDKRDQAIKEIGQYIQVTTINAPDGSLGVFIGGTQRLVLSNQAQQLSIVGDSYDNSKARLSIQDSVGPRILDSSTLQGGSIAGMLRFQDQDLSDAANMLGQLATALTAKTNEQQAYGLDLGQPATSGAAIFNVGSPRVLPSQYNAKTGANFTATVGISISDATQLQAKEYELRPDTNNPGRYLVTPLSNGQAAGPAISYNPAAVPAQTVDGFTIQIGSPAPAITDRYLLQPVSQAAQNMQRVLSDPKGIAAASPIVATTAPTNTGTATIASLTVTSSTLDPTLTANITFTSGTGNYSWNLVNASNTIVSTGTGTWQAGQPIQLNGFELQLHGVPANGDTLRAAPNTFPANNNGNARSLLALRDAKMVGQSATSLGSTTSESYAQTMADIGVRVQGVQNTADISKSIAAASQAALSNTTGVNLDEEAARLIQYQQSYQAAAKVLQVAQGIFDTLLNTVGR